MLKNLDNSGNLSQRKKGFFYWISRIGVFSAVFYGTVLSALLIFENWLVFPGAGLSHGNWNPTEFKFEEVVYHAKDGTKLVGWYLNNGGNLTGEKKGNPTVLVFHGNAENVASSARIGLPLQHHLSADVMLAEYRGYGKSEGSPNEQGILQDADAAMEWLCERTGKSPSEIILFGHSLGGGPACYLAGKTGCRALILDRTFDSLVSTAQNIYPIFPIKWLMKNTMRSDVWVQNYRGPLLILHGDRDTLIPHRSAQRLFDTSPSKKKKILILKNWGHWDQFPDDFWLEVAVFFAEVLIEEDLADLR